MSKKEQPRRRSLNDRLDAELASAESISVAGINTEDRQQPSPTAPSPANPQEGGGGPAAQTALPSMGEEQEKTPILTKKATTIMPKEVFIVLQHYCTFHDMPKHRALYRFLIDGLHTAGMISDEEHQRFQDMAVLLTTTYEKK